MVSLSDQTLRLLVDGMNVIGSRPDGWWRDRDGAVRRLVGRLVRLAAATDEDVTVVLDGRPLDDLPEGEHQGVHVAYARRPGRDAADDRLVELVHDLPDPSSVRVVTSDRTLSGRVRELGAAVTGAGAFLDGLDGV
jgi:predicted RNA-binding protein with PIN domain